MAITRVIYERIQLLLLLSAAQPKKDTNTKACRRYHVPSGSLLLRVLYTRINIPVVKCTIECTAAADSRC